MAKIHLDDDFFMKDATVYGIVSELPDYRLCFFLNQLCQLQLQRNHDDREYKFKGNNYLYSEFSYQHPVLKTYWNFTSNRSYGLATQIDELRPLNSAQRALLVPDLKSFDYFLWYEDLANNQLDELLNNRLKQLSYVRAFKKIDPAQSKNLKNLLLEY